MPKIVQAEVQREAAAFYVQYGRAVDAWASLEKLLADCFGLLTGMERRLSSAVFYSGRSFQTRRDLLAAALDHTALEADKVRFLRAAIKKASSYAETRNKIAHRVIAFNADRMRVEMFEGDELSPSSDNVFLIDDLANVTTHLLVLHDVIFEVLFAGEPAVPPSEGLERVRVLPKDAHLPSDARSTKARPMLLVRPDQTLEISWR